jgi:hypothetical protein
MTKLASPQIVVLIENPNSDELTEYTVQTDNRDSIQWDVTRSRKDWPKSTDGPMLWLTFLAWHALKRSGEYSESLETFMKVTVEVRGVKEDGEVVPAKDLSGDDLAPLGHTPQVPDIG